MSDQERANREKADAPLFQRRKGKSASFSGSFNPLHFDHIAAIEEIFALGYDRIHLFVRDDPASDVVPWEVKQSWFEELGKEGGTGDGSPFHLTLTKMI